VDCHNPHYQAQTRYWRAETHLVTGNNPTVDPYDSGNNRTLITNLSPALAANYVGYYFLPDKNYPFFHKIIDGADGAGDPVGGDTTGLDRILVRGDVREEYVRGNGYAIVWSKNHKHRITYINANGQTMGGNTKIFRPEGANAMIDTNNFATSLCAQCHTQTDHFRADGSGPDQTHTSQSWANGQNCFNGSCHKPHPQGFKKGASCGDCHGTVTTSGTLLRRSVSIP
jgi:hypothetical protein